MNEIRKPFNEVLSKEQIHNLYVKCNYDKNNEELYFESNDFIDGFALILYGERDIELDINYSNIIDTNGNFIDILLDKNIKYSNGEIVKLKDEDKGSYFFEISRIHESKYKNKQLYSNQETSYFVIKVNRYPNNRDGVALDLYYVISPRLDVIATFTDTNTWENEFGGYKNCNVYTKREFYFVNEEREFLIFSQKLITNSGEDGFFDYSDYTFDEEDYDEEDFDEEDFDEETMKKVIAKYKGELDEDDEEYDEIPDVEDINFFFEDTTNKLYKDVFKEKFHTLYGIIDCKIKSNKQLSPFTDNLSMAYNIIWKRWRADKDGQSFCMYHYGWSFDDKRFYGYVLHDKFLQYPPRVKGLTLKYLYKFYPKKLKWMSDNEIILIPNNLLDTLGNSKLIRSIRLNQEIHLSYSAICSITDTVESSEYCGVVSSYQGKTLTQIIYTKGGTKHLVDLLESGKLEIDRNVLEDLSKNAFNDIEKKCYGILISVIDDIQLNKERYDAWAQQQMDEESIREANRQFNDMMNDFDAWGNID